MKKSICQIHVYLLSCLPIVLEIRRNFLFTVLSTVTARFKQSNSIVDVPSFNFYSSTNGLLLYYICVKNAAIPFPMKFTTPSVDFMVRYVVNMRSFSTLRFSHGPVVESRILSICSFFIYQNRIQ